MNITILKYNYMKRLIALTIIALLPFCLMAKNLKKVKYTYKEASELTLIGKMFKDTPNPYERIDFSKYEGFNERELQLLRMPAGMAVTFRTDSPLISVLVKYNSVTYIHSMDDCRTATRGFDLYIKRKGEWIWAGSCAAKDNISKPQLMNLVNDMDDSTKECLMYFPLYSQLESVKVAVEQGCFIEPGEVPFRHRVVIYGSSHTQGNSTVRPGLCYPSIFTRRTGIQLLNMSVDGNCMMQPRYAEMFRDADVDAFIFDSLANGSDKTIEENLFNFIETIQSTHPGVPLIFQRSVWRERDNFNLNVRERDMKRVKMYEKLMAEALKKYKDVYFITPMPNTKYHDTSEDGTHFGDYGHNLWADSIIKPVTKILKKYGIK